MQFLSLAILSAATLAAGFAQQPTTVANTAERIGAPRSMDPKEAQFVRDALNSGRREVQLGQIALRQSGNDDVKQFAQRLINDHTSANQRLEQIMKEYSISDNWVPSANSPAYKSNQERTSMHWSGIDPKTNGGVSRLPTVRFENLSGPKFDHAFTQQIVDDHESDITQFDSRLGRTTNADLKNFIGSTLPMLKEHLSQARNLVK